MPKTFKTAKEVEAIRQVGTWKDAGCRNLYLQVAKTGDNPVTKSWLFRFMMHGKADSMGLGGYPLVPLAEARDAALEARRLVRKGINPRIDREERKAAKKVESARAIPFRTYAQTYITQHEKNWRNQKHKDQWRNTLQSYVYPVFGEVPVPEVNTELVLKVIEPEWLTKTETMSRVRGRIEKILEAAKVDGLRDGENPARWAGHLKLKLPKRERRRRRVKHHPALPYAEAPAFMTKLRKLPSTSAAALEFCILTACRTSEAIAATWSEFDLDARAWTIPGDRMKGYLQHVVSLSPAAVRVLERMKGQHKTWVFPSYRDEHLGDNAMLALLDRMGFGHVTTHGMRSTFRTWAGEQTIFPREVVEVCLAHINDDETEAAYLRTEVPGTLFIDKRRELLNRWAKYLAGEVPLVRPAEAAE
jgi:integrase